MHKKTIPEAGSDFLKLWNEEFNKYPLSERILIERVYVSPDLIEEASFALYRGSELAAVLASKKGPEFDERAREACFISLLYVNPEFRGQGLGSRLTELVKEEAKKRNLKYILTGCDYDNLFSGVFTEEARSFFEKQGFFMYEKNYNLLTRTYNPVADERVRICASEAEKEHVSALCGHFHRRWQHELKDVDYGDLVVLEEEGKIIGFARIADSSSKKLPNSMTFHSRHENFGGLGPLGIDPAQQGRGLGKVLVENAVRLLFLRGADAVLVDWTDKTEFYRKCGFEEIADEFSVLVFSKSL
jgi:GNAT superfamily N-acetyltransferase